MFVRPWDGASGSTERSERAKRGSHLDRAAEKMAYKGQEEGKDSKRLCEVGGLSHESGLDVGRGLKLAQAPLSTQQHATHLRLPLSTTLIYSFCIRQSDRVRSERPARMQQTRRSKNRWHNAKRVLRVAGTRLGLFGHRRCQARASIVTVDAQ